MKELREIGGLREIGEIGEIVKIRKSKITDSLGN